MWDLPRPGIKAMSPALAGIFFTIEPPGKPKKLLKLCLIQISHTLPQNPARDMCRGWPPSGTTTNPSHPRVDMPLSPPPDRLSLHSLNLSCLWFSWLNRMWLECAVSNLGLALKKPGRFFFCSLGNWLPWKKSSCSTGGASLVGFPESETTEWLSLWHPTGDRGPGRSPAGRWLSQDHLATWARTSPSWLPVQCSVHDMCYH